MVNDIGGVVLLVLIFAVLIFGSASLYRGMFVRGRTTAQGEDVEDLMFHDDYVRHQNEAAGLVAPHWWERRRRRR